MSYGLPVFRTPQVILFSSDLPGAAAFYTGLGFTQTFRTPADGEPIHVDLVLDGHKLGIASVTSTPSNSSSRPRESHGHFGRHLMTVPLGKGGQVQAWVWAWVRMAARAWVT